MPQFNSNAYIYLFYISIWIFTELTTIECTLQALDLSHYNSFVINAKVFSLKQFNYMCPALIWSDFQGNFRKQPNWCVLRKLQRRWQLGNRQVRLERLARSRKTQSIGHTRRWTASPPSSQNADLRYPLGRERQLQVFSSVDQPDFAGDRTNPLPGVGDDNKNN